MTLSETARATMLRSRWVPSAMVCCVLAGYFLTLQHGGLAFESAPAHRYSAYEPAWTQLVLPRLGLPTAPPTSPTIFLTRLAQTAAPAVDVPLLAAVAVLTHVVALALFAVFLLQLRVQPLVVGVAVASLGLWPTFSDAATRWTPYLMLPPLLLGALVVRRKWIETRRLRWSLLMVAVALCAVAESVYAAPLLLPLLWFPPAANPAVRARLWVVVPIVGGMVAGLALVLIGAAATWREAVTADAGSPPSWWDAFVAVTTRWARVVEIYAGPPGTGELRARLAHGPGVGLLQGVLALVGVFAFLRVERREGLVLFATLATAAGVHSWFRSPVSAVSPTAVVAVVLVFVFVAFGIAQMATAAKRPALTATVVGAALAVYAVAAREMHAGEASASPVRALTRVAFDRPAVAVASDVERDRHLEHVMATVPSATRINRIPQTPTAIRRAMAEAPVLVWSADYARVSALGLMLAPVDRSQAFEVIDALPCRQLPARTWVDITAIAVSGGLGFHADRSSVYEAAIEADGQTPVAMHVEDALSRVTPQVLALGPGRLHLRVASQRSLPLVRFDRVPDGARVQIETDDARQAVHVCGASVRGVVVNLAQSTAAVALPLDADSAFSHGWHAVEGRRGDSLLRWSSAATATVEVQLPSEATAIEVSVDAAPASADPGATFTLEVNGRPLDSQPMPQGHRTYTWVVERGLTRHGLNVVRLHGPDTVTPLASGINDGRSLGFSLTAFRLRRIGP